jgi:Flp pilus assembly protein TadG
MRRSSRPRGAWSQGSSSVELAVLAPVLLLVFAVVIAAGRLVTAQGAVDQAATAAARAASLATTPAQGTTTAQSTAGDVLTQQGLPCTRPNVTVDTAGLTTPVGTPGTVTARIACTVSFSSLLLPGFPGATTLSGEFSSPIDPDKARS